MTAIELYRELLVIPEVYGNEHHEVGAAALAHSDARLRK
jgi:hypothetical protein